jgi:glycerophosphoryl diester phosphodiesterase
MMVLMALTSKAQLIIAHRGASHDAPENTLASFKLAWEQKADGIEGDFYLTKDGKIVCIHDKTTKRTSGQKVELDVAASTLAELRKVDVGAWKDPKYAGEKMPTLEEVLAIVPAGKVFFIEIK